MTLVPRAGRVRPLEFRFNTSRHDLEAAILAAVSSLAAERGVSVQDARLELSAPTPRTIDFRLTLMVKAMIVSAAVTARGKAEIGDDLCARVTELDLEGDGMIAGMARAALEPQLAKIRGKAYPIAAVQIPGLAVDDVAASVGEELALTVRLKKTA